MQYKNSRKITTTPSSPSGEPAHPAAGQGREEALSRRGKIRAPAQAGPGQPSTERPAGRHPVSTMPSPATVPASWTRTVPSWQAPNDQRRDVRAGGFRETTTTPCNSVPGTHTMLTASTETLRSCSAQMNSVDWDCVDGEDQDRHHRYSPRGSASSPRGRWSVPTKSTATSAFTMQVGGQRSDGSHFYADIVRGGMRQGRGPHEPLRKKMASPSLKPWRQATPPTMSGC